MPTVSDGMLKKARMDGTIPTYVLKEFQPGGQSGQVGHLVVKHVEMDRKEDKGRVMLSIKDTV